MKLALYISLLVTSSLAFTLPAQQDGPLDVTSGHFAYHEALDANFELRWNFNSTHIVFETKVKTNGYIGFGISGNGAMFPSDVIIGWVSNGHAHFSDRHGTGHIMPPVDTSQDWHLLSGTESGHYTTLTMIRKLDTCDSQDMAIKEGTTRVIYSYSDQDPSSDDSISYHGADNRGTKSLLLLDPPTKDQGAQALPDDVTTLEFLNGNYSLPSKDTTYSCLTWKIPDLKEKHHMIRFEPVIQKGHEKVVHHIILYYCSAALDDNYVGTRFDCYHHNPHQVHSCEHVFIAWAIGGTGFDYPLHVGHSLGAPGDPRYFKMETHYDNPAMKSGIVDNSGIRIYLTKQLRKYDAGILEAGVHVDKYQIVPPYFKDFTSQGFCHQECMSEALGDDKMHVFSNLLHAHLLGTKLRTRIIRNGVELPPLQEDNNYDFNFQEQRMLPEERVIEKGDALIVECDYDSTQRTTITYGGLGTRQEMCLSFLLYYPKAPLSKCMSRTNYKIPQQFRGRQVFDIVEHLDWTREDVRDGFVKDYQESQEYNVCTSSSNHYQFNLRLTPKMTVSKTYTHPNTCQN